MRARNSSLRRTAAIGVLTAISLIGVTAGAAPSVGEQTAVGVVAEYRPASARFTFSRGPQAQQAPIQIGAVMMAGDRVKLPAAASVTVQLANGELLQFKGPGTFTAPAAARSLGKLAAVFRSLPALFDDEYRLAGTAAARGGENCVASGATIASIDVPILAPDARVKAGTRDIPLGWRGGCPPFVVSVRAGMDRVVHRESIAGWQVRLDQVPLSVGRYSILIQDSTGKRYETTLEARAEMPAPPADLAADGSPLGVAAQAVWLAGQEGGRWRLDSFDRLRPLIRSGDPLAGTIGDGLLWGRPVQSVPSARPPQ
jgi:hypothetical protein